MVYVLGIDGQPLMPTNNAKARILLKAKRAKVKTVKPFTIQLLYETTIYTQPITLGIDSGYLNIGFSAITDTKELISGDVNLLQDVSKRLDEKRLYRRIRRQNLRYRAPRFNNRKRDEGWLAPSIQHKLDSHIRFIDKLKSILPITKTIIEVANFDIQKIKDSSIKGKEYQQGEQYRFENLRAYILHRDNYKCQNPDCRNKDPQSILQVHHILFKDNGGTDVPSNLVTLCSKCHSVPNHKKGRLLYKWQTNRPKVKGFKEATFMSIVRWKLINLIDCIPMYGYITKAKRVELGVAKSHNNDAFVIAGGNKQLRVEPITYKQVRRNNRSLEYFYDAKYIDIRTGEKVKANELNCGRRTRNKNKNSDNLKKYRGPKISKGQRRIRTQRYFCQPNDLVKYLGKIYTVKGNSGSTNQIVLKETNKWVMVRHITSYRFSKGFMFIMPASYQK